MEFPPSAAPVESLFADYHALHGAVSAENVSDRVALDTHFRKLFVLAAASHLEALMGFHMNDHFEALGETTHEFVRRFALDRKFFTWFDFTSSMPKKFFRQFGTRCEEQYVESLGKPAFEEAAKSFMLLCTTRNNLVHGNLAEYSFELTPGEIEAHFRNAKEFPDLAMRIVKSTGSIAGITG